MIAIAFPFLRAFGDAAAQIKKIMVERRV